MSIVTGILLVVIGLVACFFGKRLYRIVLALTGFIIGYYIGTQVLVGQPEATQILGSVAAGFVLALLFWTFYKFGYILLGIYLGLAVATLVSQAIRADQTVSLVIAIVLAIIGALLGAALADLMIRLGTAFGGAVNVVAGVAAIAAALNISLPLLDPTTSTLNADSSAGIVTIIAVIVLGVVGFIYQTRTQGGQKA